MPDSDASTAVSRAELDRLASLFDRFEFADDPDAIETREAEESFNREVARIYNEKVLGRYQSISLDKFRSAVRTQCRRRLRK